MLLGAILLPGLLGASDQTVGVLELMLTAAALAAAVGPLGTQYALMYEEFRGSRQTWKYSVRTSIVGGLAIGGVAALTLGPTAAVAAAFLGGAFAIHRVVSFRLRTDDAVWPLTLSTFLFGSAFSLGFLTIERSENGPETLVAILIAAALIGSIPGFFRSRSTDSDNQIKYRAMLAYGIPLSLSAMSDWAVAAGDRYVIQAILGLDAVGQYGIVYRSTMVISGVISTLVIWWQAEAMRRGGAWARSNLSRYLQIGFFGTITLSAIAYVPLTVFLARVTSLELSTARWAVGSLILSIIGFILLMGFVHLFAAEGKVRLIAWLSAGNATLNITLNLILIGRFGLVGATLATAVSQCITAGAALLLSRPGRARRAQSGEGDYSPRDRKGAS